MVLRFGGVDAVINTAAVYPTSDRSAPAEATWDQALSVNVTSSYVLAQEAAEILGAQGLTGHVIPVDGGLPEAFLR